MTGEAQTAPKQGGGAPPKRLMRNYLLNPGFQLKYTGYVVLVTVLVTSGVGGWLGWEAYNFSTAMSDMLVMQDGGGMEVDDTLQEILEAESAAEDARVRNTIIGGIVTLVVLLSFLLGVTGIIITHKIVGPAYKLKLLLGDVAKGQLNLKGGLRKGDELQDVGDAFKAMVRALHDRQTEEVAEIDGILEDAKSADADEALIERITSLRERMSVALED